MKLEPGRIYGLLGENGVGKTTLLTLLCGLKKPLGGSITVDVAHPVKAGSAQTEYTSNMSSSKSGEASVAEKPFDGACDVDITRLRCDDVKTEKNGIGRIRK